MKKKKIGIPRTANYYQSGVFWKHFFLSLGCKIVLSPETNHKIINNGNNNLSNINCYQNKIYFGHIKELSNSCDYILIYESCNYSSKCINYKLFLENLKNHLSSSQMLLFNSYKIPIFEIFKISFKITKNPIKILISYIKATSKQNKYNQNLQNYQKHQLINQNNKVLIIGNNNIIEEKFVLNKIINMLTKNNITQIFQNYLSLKEALFFSKNLPYKITNKEIKRILGTINYYQYCIKQIIYLSNSNCILDKYIHNYIKNKTLKSNITVFEINNYQHLETKLELLIDTINNSKTQ